ncbi:PHP domain-containing protein [Desulfocurvus sp. DL9XJH121]
MILCDLHFHANIGDGGGRRNLLRLRRCAAGFQRHGLHCVASTEHAFKQPLTAYLRLAEAARDTDAAILPGVEEVSAEGVEIIFLFRDEDALRRGLAATRTFFWPVRDVGRMARDMGALALVPHPFHIGRTGAGRVLSRRDYLNLLNDVDYVEIHNGSALNISHRMHVSRITPLFPNTVENLGLTLDLPLHLRGGQHTGWSVGSDAHHPGQQYIVGRTEHEPAPGEAVFDLLARRVHFTPHILQRVSPQASRNCCTILREFQSVLREGAAKRCKRALALAQDAVNL